MYEELHPFLPPSREQPVQLELCGISWCDGGYRIARSRSPLTVFEYVIAGSGTVRVDGAEYAASAGQVYIIPEGSDHLYYADPRDPWIKVFFNVRGRLVGRLLKSYGLTGRVVLPGADTLGLFMQFLEIARAGKVHEEIIGPCALKLHEIVQRLAEETGEEPPVPEEARRLKALLDSRIGGEISTEEMAAALFRSKDYVIKLFRSAYGETPHAYFLRQKMQLAAGLLTGTGMSVKQVAAALGYTDQHYFSNVFKKATGMSPVAFRRNG